MAQFDDESPGKAPFGEGGPEDPGSGRTLFWSAIMLSFVVGCTVAIWLYTTDLNTPASPEYRAGMAPGSSGSVFPVTFDGAQFAVAERHFLRIERSSQSEIKSIELALPWPPPKLAFLASRDQPASALSLRDGVFISIQRRGTELGAQDRIATIYPVYLQGEVNSGPAELSLHTFSGGSVYDGQELYIGRREEAAVHYLCFMDEHDLAPALCRGERSMGDRFTVIYRFHRAHLDDWESIEEMLTLLAAELQRPATE